MIASGDKTAPPKGQRLCRLALRCFPSLEYPPSEHDRHLIGGVAGGPIQRNFPDKVDKLALLCPSGIGPQKVSFHRCLSYDARGVGKG